MPHVPDTVPGKRVTGAGARTEGREASRPRWEPYAGKPHVRFYAGCALQARRTQLPEMAAAAKPSEQPRTESCVVSGNGRCEA
jgi:hypothetical protein